MTFFVSLQNRDEPRLPGGLMAETGYYGPRQPASAKYELVRLLDLINRLLSLCGFIVSGEHEPTDRVSHEMALSSSVKNVAFLDFPTTCLAGLEEVCGSLTRWNRASRAMPICDEWEFQSLLQSVFNYSAYSRYHEHAWLSIAGEWTNELYCKINTFSSGYGLTSFSKDLDTPVSAEPLMASRKPDTGKPPIADNSFSEEEYLPRVPAERLASIYSGEFSYPIEFYQRENFSEITPTPEVSFELDINATKIRPTIPMNMDAFRGLNFKKFSKLGLD